MKKIISLALVGVLSLATVFAAGCDDPKADSATDIEITFWRSGMGDEFMKDIIAAFKVKYPEYNIIFNPETKNTAIPQSRLFRLCRVFMKHTSFSPIREPIQDI